MSGGGHLHLRRPGLHPRLRAHGGPGPAVPAPGPRQGDDRGADGQHLQVHILGHRVQSVLTF